MSRGHDLLEDALFAGACAAIGVVLGILVGAGAVIAVLWWCVQ